MPRSCFSNGTTRCGVLALVMTTLVHAGTVGASCHADSKLAAGAAGRFIEAYGRRPLAFEANRGQTDPRVDFVGHGPGFSVFLTGGDAVLSLGASEAASARSDERRRDAMGASLRLRLVGAKSQRGVSQGALPGQVNYFVNGDPRAWRTGIPTHAKVAYADVYPGVDIVYYGTLEGRLEHDFVLDPRVDPGIIEMRFEGADRMELDAEGNLVLGTAAGTVQLKKPHIYQETEAGRREIGGAFDRRSRNSVGFKVAAHNANRPLIIDPVLVYSTYLGGSRGDIAVGIAVDASGAAYVTGQTTSDDFPISPGAFDASHNGSRTLDVFVSKLDPAGAVLVYSTYLGGSLGDGPGDIAVDASGAAYVAGITSSTDFPTTPGAFDPNSGASVGFFVAKLDPTGGALVYSTYLGGDAFEPGLGPGFLNDIAVDSSGAATVVGQTSATNFPTTPGAYDTTYNGGYDGFVTRLDPAGATLLYSTYLGGSSGDNVFGVAVDGLGAVHVAGNTTSADFPVTPGAFDTTYNSPPPGLSSHFDGFVAKLDPRGAFLLQSTYLGGSGDDSAFAIAVDGAGASYVVGVTRSGDFPITPGAFDTSYNGGVFFGDAFVTKLDPSGTALVYSTYLGGSDDEQALGVAVDASGAAYAVGETRSSDFPVSPDAFDMILGGFSDAFVSKLDPTGASVPYSTYLGGSKSDVASEIAADRRGAVYVTGLARSSDFPTTPEAYDTTFNVFDDSFVVKLCIGCDERPPCLECSAEAHGRVELCHLPPGNPENLQTLQVPPSALPAHCDHGDTCGPCATIQRPDPAVHGSEQEMIPR